MSVTLRLLIAATLLAFTVVGGTALAQPSAADKDTARLLMDEGDKHFKSQRYAEALKAYQGAHAIMGVPTTGVAVGNAYEKLGKLVEARDLLLEVARMRAKANEPQAFINARSEAKVAAKAIQARTPTLVFRVTGVAEGVAVTVLIDGEKVPPAAVGLPRRLNPGEHKIIARAEGYVEITTTVVLSEGSNTSKTVEMKPAQEATPVPTATATATAPTPAPPPAPPSVEKPGLSPLVFIGFGLAGVGAIAGGITGGLALSQSGDLEGLCSNGVCSTPEAQDKFDSVGTLSHVATISFALAGAGAVVGLVGLMMGPSADEPDEVTLRLGPGSMSLQGVF